MEIKNRYYTEEMDNCIRASSVLYARLFEFGERVYLADEGSIAELSKDREIFELLGQEHRWPNQRSVHT